MKSLLFAALFAAPLFASAQSITNLPKLATLLIHHYECRLALIPASGDVKELNFQISTQVSGHAQTDYTLAQGADKLVASANAQMMSINWSRSSKTVASSQAWVQNSTTQAFVLMVADPSNENNQAHMNCNAVTFDQVKK